MSATNHQIDVSAVVVGGEQLLDDVPDAANEALLAASRRVGVFGKWQHLLRTKAVVIRSKRTVWCQQRLVGWCQNCLPCKNKKSNHISSKHGPCEENNSKKCSYPQISNLESLGQLQG